jgi:hypothetical protein
MKQVHRYVRRWLTVVVRTAAPEAVGVRSADVRRPEGVDDGRSGRRQLARQPRHQDWRRSSGTPSTCINRTPSGRTSARNSITVRGQWMYPRTANRRLIQLIRGGVLTLDHERITTFPLEQANEAVAYAASHSGPFDRTVLLPNS